MTVPDNPIQIADAALYLKSTNPGLGIQDPYELNQVSSRRRSTLKAVDQKVQALASDEIDLFKNGDAVIGASCRIRPTLIAAKAPVEI